MTTTTINGIDSVTGLYTSRYYARKACPAPGDYEGRSHRACVWYNRARAAFDLATLDTLTTAADKAADRVPTEAWKAFDVSGKLM